MATKKIVWPLANLGAFGASWWYTYHLVTKSDLALDVKTKDAVIGGLRSVLVIEVEKMGSVKWTPQQKALVQRQLRDEEFERAKTGSLKENCKKTVLFRWGGEDKWKVVGKEGRVVAVEEVVRGEKVVGKEEVEGGKEESVKTAKFESVGKGENVKEEGSKMGNGVQKVRVESVEKVGVKSARTVKTEGVKTVGLEDVKQDGVESVKKNGLEGVKKVGVEGLKTVKAEDVKGVGLEAVKREELAVKEKIARGSASGKDGDGKA